MINNHYMGISCANNSIPLAIHPGPVRDRPHPGDDAQEVHDHEEGHLRVRPPAPGRGQGPLQPRLPDDRVQVRGTGLRPGEVQSPDAEEGGEAKGQGEQRLRGGVA